MNINKIFSTAVPCFGNLTFLRFLTLALLLSSPLCFGQTIVVIESYHSEYKWDSDYLVAIQEELGDDNDIHVLALDTKRLLKSEWPEKVASIQRNVNKVKPDIAILGDDNAFLLMADYLVDKQIPVVFFGVNGGHEQYPVLEHPLVTGVLERPFFAQSVRHAKNVIRPHDRFLILMDDSPTMRNAVNEYFGEARQATIYGSQIPIFSFWDISIGEHQAIGGFTVSARQEGITAARLASLILNGVRPDQVPQIKSLSGQYVYSESGLEHWNIDLSPLIASQSVYVK